MKGKRIVGSGIVLFLLLVTLISGTIFNLSPADNIWQSSSNANFTFDLSNYTNVNCDLVLDQTIVQTKNATASNIFTETLSEGLHAWKINCSSGNNSEISISRNIYVDTTAPQISLGFPLDYTNYTNLTSITYTPTDNLATNFNCSLNLNGVIVNSFVANNTEENISVSSNIGTNYWNVSCQDSVDNQITSATRSFLIINTTNTTTPEPAFLVNLENVNYNPGVQALMQIVATNGSNVSVKVCPNQQGFVGFVLCYNTLTFTSNSFPTIEVMPYTNVSGDYIIDATMKYGSQTKSYQQNFTINNNLVLTIDGDQSIDDGETTEIKIKASGGIQPYTYSWTLDDDSTSSKKALNFSFDNPGTYEQFILVTDNAGNTVNSTFNIVVRELLELNIIVTDTVSGSIVSGVTVDVDDISKTTNSNGKVVYLLSKGNYDILVSNSNYEFFIEEDYRLKTNSTKTLEIVRTDNTDPVVTVLSPENGDKLRGTELNISFKVSDESSLVVCEIYTSVDDDAWFTKRTTREVTSTANQLVTIDDFELGDYSFKIECEDSKGNTGSSNEIEVSFVNESNFISSDRSTNLIDQLYTLLDSLPKQNVKQKEVLDDLGYENTIKQAIKTVERTTRDIYNIEYRRDLSDDQKSNKQKELMENINEIYKSTPIGIEILNSNTFVKYIQEVELQPIIKEYAEIEGYQDLNKYLKSAIEAQKIATVTANVRTVKLTYFDDVTKVITLISNKIAFTNDSVSYSLLEYIPKELVESTDDLTILTPNKIINKDPMIKFENTNSIIYYVSKSINPKEFEKSNTIVLPNSYSESANSITGNAIFDLNPNINSKFGLVMLIVVLILVYGGYSFNAFGKLKFFYYVVAGDKRMHNMQMLINDAIDNISAKNYDKAYLIYREVKLYYDKLSLPAKNELYEQIVGVCNKLDYEYAGEMVEIITKKISDGEKEKASYLYKKLRAIYKKLNEDDKKKVYDDILKISGSIAK